MSATRCGVPPTVVHLRLVLMMFMSGGAACWLTARGSWPAASSTTASSSQSVISGAVQPVVDSGPGPYWANAVACSPSSDVANTSAATVFLRIEIPLQVGVVAGTNAHRTGNWRFCRLGRGRARAVAPREDRVAADRRGHQAPVGVLDLAAQH